MGTDTFNNWLVPNDGNGDEDEGDGPLAGSTVIVQGQAGTFIDYTLDGTVANIGDTLTVTIPNMSDTETFVVQGDGADYIVGYFQSDPTDYLVFSDQPITFGDSFTTGNGLGNFNPQTACFAQGSRILTTRGEMAVEVLRPGDMLVLADGGTAPVRWIGSRRMDCARHPRPWDVMPVRVVANAFGPGMPHDDLVLSPDHAVFAAGALIPIRYLINGGTIRQEQRRRIVYYHVELPAHAVLLAQGLPAESFLNTGNRGAFDNAGAAVDLHADFAVRSDAARAVWSASACAPLLTSGAPLAAERSRLLARAATLGLRLTDDPAVALRIGDTAIAPRSRDGWLCWTLPQGLASATLCSRRFVPSQTVPESDDTRALGVAVVAVLRDGAALDLADPALAGGWAAPEAGLRWTDGAAILPLDGARELAVRIAPVGRYWEEPDAPALAMPVAA
jgi:hypothetical protein